FLEVGPLMNSDQCHGSVHGLIIERQIFGDTMDGGSQMLRALGTHRGRRFDGNDMPVQGFIRTGTGANVEESAGGTECLVYQGCDSGVSAAWVGIVLAMGVVVKTTRAGFF